MSKKTEKKETTSSNTQPSEEHFLMSKEESSIVPKKNEPLMKKDNDSSFNNTEENFSTKEAEENTKPEDSTKKDETSFSEENIHKNQSATYGAWKERKTSFMQQFFFLLLSFITAIVPDMRDIFSVKVFMNLCKMVRIEHTLFALPFAYTGLVIASLGSISISAFFFLTLAMFGIRSFAMTLNRLIDLNYDKLNPRTASRELVTGDVTIAQAKSFLLFSLIVFIVSTACINTFLLMLAPIPIILSIIYSYTKRYTWACHFILGATLALAPIAGELAVVNTVSNGVALLAFGILFWVAGFDILYSCLDKDFDEKHKLYSVPVCFGIPTALLIAKFCHINTIIFFLFFGLFSGLGFLWYLVWVLIAVALLWEHHILSEKDLSKMNQAFFTINACISIAVLIGTFLG